MNYYQPPQEPRFQYSHGPLAGTPWPAIIIAIVVLGVLCLAMVGSGTRRGSSTLDKAEDCCRVLSGDNRPLNSAGDRQ